MIACIYILLLRKALYSEIPKKMHTISLKIKHFHVQYVP